MPQSAMDSDAKQFISDRGCVMDLDFFVLYKACS